MRSSERDAVNDENGAGVHWSFWAIGVVALIYNVAGIINFVTQMNADTVSAMPEMYRAIIENRSVWATGGFALAVFGGALGCLLLLLRKPASYYVFIASLLGAIVTMVHTLGMVASDSSPVGATIGNLVQLVVTAFLIWYSKRAERKGWSG
jgi:hypothetical protein